MKRFVQTILTLFLVLSLLACRSIDDNEVVDEDDISKVEVIDTKQGDYSILMPFDASPLNQAYSYNYREIDMMEIGSRLVEKSKEHFNPKNYYMSEGSLIDQNKYYELIGTQSDRNPNGLNIADLELKDGSVTIKNPKLVSSILEINFHNSKDPQKVDGVAIALVLKRVQILDESIGSTHKLSDEVLYEAGRTLGLRLYSYLSTLEGMADIPMYLTLYAQESDVDQLPGNYLPGHYIGEAFFQSRTDQFKRNNESWYLLNDSDIEKIAPEASSAFMRFKKNIQDFASDESIGVVGMSFVVDNRLEKINIEIITGSKTYTELYAIGQYIKQQINLFDAYPVPIRIDIRIHQNTWIVISKDAGSEVQIIELH